MERGGGVDTQTKYRQQKGSQSRGPHPGRVRPVPVHVVDPVGGVEVVPRRLARRHIGHAHGSLAVVEDLELVEVRVAEELAADHVLVPAGEALGPGLARCLGRRPSRALLSKSDV